jgi:hypothetical protein
MIFTHQRSIPAAKEIHTNLVLGYTSQTAIVWNFQGVPPARRTPAFTASDILPG